MPVEVDIFRLLSNCLNKRSDNIDLRALYESKEDFSKVLSFEEYVNLSSFCDRFINEYLDGDRHPDVYKSQNLKIEDILDEINYICNRPFDDFMDDNDDWGYKASGDNFSARKIAKDIAAHMFYEKDSDKLIEENPFMEINSFGWNVFFELVNSIYNENVLMAAGRFHTNRLGVFRENALFCLKSNYELYNDGKEDFFFQAYLIYRYIIYEELKIKPLYTIYEWSPVTNQDWLIKMESIIENLETLISINKENQSSLIET